MEINFKKEIELLSQNINMGIHKLTIFALSYELYKRVIESFIHGFRQLNGHDGYQLKLQ